MRKTREIIRCSNWKTRLQRVNTALLCMLLVFVFAADLHAADEYTITATAGNNGSISPSGAVPVNSGDSRTFTITSNTGYHVADVTVDGISQGAINSYTFSNVTANHTIQASFTSNVVFAVNCGGPQYTDSTGVIYTADTMYSGGYLGTTAATTSGTVDDALYQTERYGNFSYNVPVANGNYSVTLRFSEIYWTAPGQRLFSVVINGQKVISNLDLYARVGKNAAYDVVIPVSVTNGAISINFNSLVNNAKVSAIRIAASDTIAYAITESAGTGGTITPADTATVNPGTSQTFTITPNTGYHVVDVSVDGISQGAITSYTFNNVTANHTIQAVFFSSSDGNVIAVNCGGSQYTDSTGVTYLADTINSGGSRGYTAATIGGTADGTLYQTERWGNFSYSIPVANGNYSVTLKFAEFFYSAPGQRIFSVDINGQTVISNLDIYTKVGTNAAYDVVIPVSVTSGAININFSGQVQNPKVSAIKIAVSGTLSYAITASAGTGGAISPADAVTVNPGGNLTFTITPNASHHVVDVKVDGVSQGAITSYTFANVNANHTIQAIFFSSSNGNVFATNSGGPQYTDSTGYTYLADTMFNGGSIGATTATISGTADGALFQTERWGDFSYNIPVTNGNYSVTLKFAELYLTAPGQRVFSVAINGQTVISNLDLYATVGKNAAYDVVIPVSVTSGSINIHFIRQVQSPIVDAIKIAASAASSYAITASASTGGIITPADMVIVNSGGNQTFTITPNSGYRIADVTVDGVSQGAITSYTFSNVSADHTIVATFAIIPNTITLTIDSPSDGVSISRPDVMVTGTVTNAGDFETGVTVNGVVAIVYGNQFVANHVSLQEGPNVITATATDINGLTSTASLTVTAVTTGKHILLTADKESGVAPLEASLRIDGSFSIANSSISAIGPVQPNIVTMSADKYQTNMTAEGIYFFTASTTGPDGNTYQDSIAIGASNTTVLDNIMRSRWTAMTDSLLAGDSATALTYISPATRAIYLQMFTALSTQLPTITATQRGFNFLSISNGQAKYELITIENGKTYSYEVIFATDAYGLWKIQEF